MKLSKLVTSTYNSHEMGSILNVSFGYSTLICDCSCLKHYSHRVKLINEKITNIKVRTNKPITHLNDMKEFFYGGNIVLNEDNINDIHEVASLLMIPYLLQHTVSFRLLLKFFNHAIRVILSKNSQLLNQSYNFLASLYPLFCKSRFFFDLSPEDIIKIFQSSTIKYVPPDDMLLSLSSFINKWDKNAFVVVLDYIPKNFLSSSALSDFFMQFSTNSESFNKKFSEMRIATLAKQQHFPFAQNPWDEFITYFSSFNISPKMLPNDALTLSDPMHTSFINEKKLSIKPPVYISISNPQESSYYPPETSASNYPKILPKINLNLPVFLKTLHENS